MIGTYDKKLWEQLVATVSAFPGWTAYSTFASVGSNSTAAMGAAPAATSAQFVTAAYDKSRNVTWLLYRYSS